MQHVLAVTYYSQCQLDYRVRSSTTTTTMVIDSKSGGAGSPPARGSKKTITDDLYSTFSSPLAWILVVALVITWSCVFVIMFDLMDYKTISGLSSPITVRKSFKGTGRSRGGLSKISSDPMKVVNDAVDESANLFSVILNFAANLVAPDDDEGWLEEEEEVVVKIKKAKVYATEGFQVM
uniref:triadin-like n=1 Tax=Centroberyx gerrardi TaxID=166262 RepID=UPI003AADC4AA